MNGTTPNFTDGFIAGYETGARDAAKAFGLLLLAGGALWAITSAMEAMEELDRRDVEELDFPIIPPAPKRRRGGGKR